MLAISRRVRRWRTARASSAIRYSAFGATIVAPRMWFWESARILMKPSWKLSILELRDSESGIITLRNLRFLAARSCSVKPTVATEGKVPIRRTKPLKSARDLVLPIRLEASREPSKVARSVEDSPPIQSPMAKMFLAEVSKNLLTEIPFLVNLTPAFSRPNSRAGFEPVARTTQSTRTIFSWRFWRKTTRLTAPSSGSSATTLAFGTINIPSSFVK